MKTAIVHEYLVQYGGAERVLEAIHDLFPDAPVYTLLYNQAKMPDEYRKWDIRPSALSSRKWIQNHYKAFFYFYPYYIEQFDLRGYDLVISSSYAYAHGIITSPETCHICYCHTPMRFAWIQEKEYSAKIPLLARPVYRKMVTHLKKWDIQASKRPDFYIASCQNVANRIKNIYHRNSIIISPPVNVSEFSNINGRKDYYLLVSRLVHPYKKIDIAIEAFNRNGKNLKIVGDGTDRKYLEKMAEKNIAFLGEKKGAELSDLYQHAAALIFPSEDDFGIVPLEANAAGCPVIAYAKGGILETQIENKTAVYFHESTPFSLNNAIKIFENASFNSTEIRKNSLRFRKELFQEKLGSFIQNIQIIYFDKKSNALSGDKNE
jgi:glycosyltransferase involved in cell wall biosynthesis